MTNAIINTPNTLTPRHTTYDAVVDYFAEGYAAHRGGADLLEDSPHRWWGRDSWLEGFYAHEARQEGREACADYLGRDACPWLPGWRRASWLAGYDSVLEADAYERLAMGPNPWSVG